MGDALSQTSPRALIVADGRTEAGLGHLARCTALACALREEGFELETIALGAAAEIELDGVHWSPEGQAAQANAEPDLLVLDTYDREAWRRLSAAPRGLLVAFADALDDDLGADVVIDLEDGAENAERVLSGLRFACLRRDFWDLPPRSVENSASRVLVTTGSGDPGGLATRLAGGLAARLPSVEIELVRGPGFEGKPPPGVAVIERPSSLAGPLLRADVVVCAGGQTMLEAAATGAPAVVVEAAANQRRQIAALAAREATLAVAEDEVPDAVERLLGSASLRGELSRRSREAVDGRGALRTASALRRLLR